MKTPLLGTKIILAFLLLLFQNSIVADEELIEKAVNFNIAGNSYLFPLLEESVSKIYNSEEEYIRNYPLSNYTFVEVPGQGKFLIDPINDSIKNQLRRGSVWEPENKKIIEEYCKEGSIALDIGAHIGTHTLTMSNSVGPFGNVFAFEPNKVIYRELCANLALNESDNVIPIRSALGNKNSIIELVTPVDYNQGGTFCIESSGGANTAALMTLDSFMLENVSFIKIDVENGEKDVLEGAEETILANRPVMLIEVQGNGERTQILGENSDLMKQQSLSKIISLGYTVEQIGGSRDYLAIPRNESEIDDSIDLSMWERKVFSENGEDGIIEKIFQVIGGTNQFFVEIGANDGITTSNAHYMRQYYGWHGMQVDINHENMALNLIREYPTAENVNDLIAEHHVPEEFDLLSIDIDYNDFYLWKAISERYRPRVVVIEYNATHLPEEDKVVIYQPSDFGGPYNYFGASIKAMYNLGRSNGYSLVYAEKRGVNLFFVRDDAIEQRNVNFKNVNDVEALYQTPKYGSGPRGGHPQDPDNREYLSSEEILEI